MVSMSETNNPPRLPHEIWLAIFEWATFLPNAFDVHVPDNFAYPGPWSQSQILTGIRESLCTKRRLVLVCKAWNALATRFLYEALPIVRPVTLTKLLYSLNNEKSRGRWTLRLDISLKDGWTPIDELADLLQSLPNLEILTVFQSGSIPTPSDGSPSFIDVLATHAARTLHVLDVSCFSNFAQHCLCKIPGVVDRRPLHVLNVRAWGSRSMQRVPIAVPFIERLNVPLQLLEPVLFCDDPPPSLSHVSLIGNYLSARVFRIWKTFASLPNNVGQHLTSLEIGDHSYPAYSPSEPSSRSFESHLRLVNETCPNLRNLTICIFYDVPLLVTKCFPLVEKLGLDLRFARERKHNSKRMWRYLCDKLLQLSETATSLRVIRIIGSPTMRDLAAHHSGILKVVSRASAELLLRYGIRFEDPSGRVLHNEEFKSEEDVPNSSAVSQ